MSIVSFTFGFFLFVFGILYYIVPKKIQWGILLCGNLVFYAYSGPRNLIYNLSCALFTWLSAIGIEKLNSVQKNKIAETVDKDEKAALRTLYGKRKKILVAVTLFLTLGVWIVLKYGPFLTDSFADVFHFPELKGTLKFIVPLGISFYTFDAVGYLIDVYRGKYGAEHNYFRFLTFLSYFPHIIQGPFSRFHALGKEIFEAHSFSYDRLCQGMSRILWGYFKKLIIADKLGISVNEIFAHYENYWGFQILCVIILYGIQIYADFSGYMDIVCGISHGLGIDLEENFRQPYFSRSVEEFWRRWHMTLGHWFRDYLFYPISMSKRMQQINRFFRSRFNPRAGKLAVSFTAMFWVWSATGLWHGANWTFLIWGWLNMIVMMAGQALEPRYAKLRNQLHISLDNPFYDLFRIVRTFALICFFRFFSRADFLHTAIEMLKKVFSGFNRKLLLTPMKFFPQLQPRDVWIVAVGVIMMLAVDVMAEKGMWKRIKEKTPFPVRDLVYIFMIFAIILFAGTGTDISANFIYANF